MNERDISRLLAARENGTYEVKTPVGYIDVLTATAVYEVKEVSDWKGALGQVLAYARYYPQHKAKLYLYGTASGAQKAVIKSIVLRSTCKWCGIERHSPMILRRRYPNKSKRSQIACRFCSPCLIKAITFAQRVPSG